MLAQLAERQHTGTPGPVWGGLIQSLARVLASGSLLTRVDVSGVRCGLSAYCCVCAGTRAAAQSTAELPPEPEPVGVAAVPVPPPHPCPSSGLLLLLDGLSTSVCTVLRARNCGLDDLDIAALVQGSRNCDHLDVLDVLHNSFSEEGARSMLAALPATLGLCDGLDDQRRRPRLQPTTGRPRYKSLRNRTFR